MKFKVRAQSFKKMLAARMSSRLLASSPTRIIGWPHSGVEQRVSRAHASWACCGAERETVPWLGRRREPMLAAPPQRLRLVFFVQCVLSHSRSAHIGQSRPGRLNVSKHARR